MKKLLYILLLLLLCITFFGCDSGEKQKNMKPGLDGKVAENVVKEDDKMILDDITPFDGKKVKIVFVGDSITYGYGTNSPESDSYPSQLSFMFDDKYEIINCGKNASYILNADSMYNAKSDQKNKYYKNTEEYKTSIEVNPDIVVIMLGINDIRSLKIGENAEKEFIEDLSEFAKEYKELESCKNVYIATSILNHHSDTLISTYSQGKLQELQRKAAEIASCDVIDVYEDTKDALQDSIHFTSDNLHIKQTGQKLIAESIYNYFKVK